MDEPSRNIGCPATGEPDRDTPQLLSEFAPMPVDESPSIGGTLR
jgi:hypothetical protein